MQKAKVIHVIYGAGTYASGVNSGTTNNYYPTATTVYNTTTNGLVCVTTGDVNLDGRQDLVITDKKAFAKAVPIVASDARRLPKLLESLSPAERRFAEASGFEAAPDSACDPLRERAAVV